MNKALKFLGIVVETFALSSCNFLFSSSNQSSQSASFQTSYSSSLSDTSAQSTLKTYKFYAINDFHGSILERNNGGYYEGGLKKVFGFLKQKKLEDPQHTIILSSGDMWQGSLESNDNYGNLITTAMNEVGFDAMAVGNHDFDYGIAKLLENKNIANFPFLGVNIMNYSSSTRWGEVQSSTTITLDGTKIGIIGSIGEGLTTSISSQHVQNLKFVEPSNLVKIEAANLRNAGCDIVVLSSHASAGDTKDYGLTSSDVNAVFCGHSHSNQNKVYSQVPYVQGACNGEYVSEIILKIDSNKKVTVSSSRNITASQSWAEDASMAQVQDSYLDAAFNTKSNEVLGTITNNALDKAAISRLGCKAIYNYVDSLNLPYNICCAMENSQRAGVGIGSFTYSDLYKATPFMNIIVILKVSGSAIKKEAGYNSTYTGDSAYYQLQDNTLYYVAVIDYIAYHQNENKHYDYFSELNYHNEKIIKEIDKYPVDLTAWYIKNRLNGIVNANDYQASSNGMDLY